MSKRINTDTNCGNQRYWQAHVKALENSGLSRAEYCRQHNIPYHAMTYWQRKGPRSGEVTTKLVPVPLPAKYIHHTSQANQTALHIILPSDLSVAVGDDFSSDTLTRLLTVLENR